MEIIFEILKYPFMQRALIAGVVLAAALAYMGVFVVMRRMSFFGDGIAHASLAGIAAGIVFGANPLLTAVISAVVFAVAIYFLEKKARLSGDAVIGIIFTSGMALGALVIGLQKGYQPDLVSFLFGNILAISRPELMVISIAAVITCSVIFAWRKKLTLLAIDEDLAKVSGINPDIYKLALYVFVAVSVVLGIKLLGIVLVSALLIIPVSAAKAISTSFRSLCIVTVVFSEIITIGGIAASYVFNLPTGATIVLCGTLVFIASLFAGRLTGRQG